MQRKQYQIPLYQIIKEFSEQQNDSFHVPGHKHGAIFPEEAKPHFHNVLALDLTELEGLDDLHAPTGVIKEAETLASEWFKSLSTYFLVNGSTVGNLAMILATCQPDDQILVQRNCHKSILNGIELAGLQPIFLPPVYDEGKKRYTSPSVSTINKAIHTYPEVKAIILTYPDYFGDTFPIKEIIDRAHAHDIVVLVDEAHGCHFSLPFINIPSAVELGADMVVQSAHKMTPALTMAAFLHIQTKRIDRKKVRHYLQMLQSSSPSYLIMGSLDIARYYLATYTEDQSNALYQYIHQIRTVFESNEYWALESLEKGKDPLKICLQVKEGINIKELSKLFEKEKIYPELITDKHLLFILGLEPTIDGNQLKKKIATIKDAYHKAGYHATIENKEMDEELNIQTLALSYSQMKKYQSQWCAWEKATGHIAAEAIIPYPPGIPLIAKGERIHSHIVNKIHKLQQQQINFQPNNRKEGLYIFAENEPKGE